MRRAKVYMHDRWAGTLTEDEEGYHFAYREEYLKDKVTEPVSLTLPLQQDPFHNRVLFPFFDGLIPEGWLLDIAEKNWKISARDRMGLLLKNFSIFKDPQRGYNLSPAYDMVAAALVVEGDDEELALTLNGKKKKIKRMNFENAMGKFEISQKAFDNIFERFGKVLPQWHAFVDISFLPDEIKGAYHKMLDQKAAQIALTK